MQYNFQPQMPDQAALASLTMPDQAALASLTMPMYSQNGGVLGPEDQHAAPWNGLERLKPLASGIPPPHTQHSPSAR